MTASLEEIPDRFEPKHFDRPPNVCKATPLEHASQDVALVSLRLERIGIHVPKKPALLMRNDHGH